jgi:hypothetical protein
MSSSPKAIEMAPSATFSAAALPRSPRSRVDKEEENEQDTLAAGAARVEEEHGRGDAAVADDDPVSPSGPLLDLSAPQCQICLESDGEIIKPCRCRWTHRKCLNEWRVHHKADAAFHACEICRFQYELDVQQESVWLARRRTTVLLLRLLWDLVCVLGAVEAGACLAAFTLRLMDSGGEGTRPLASALSADHHWLAYWLWGHLLFFFVVGVVVMIKAICTGDGYRSGYFFNDCFRFDCPRLGSGDCEGYFFLLLLLLIAVVGWFVLLFTAGEWVSTRWRARVTHSRRWVDTLGTQVRDQQGRDLQGAANV